MRLEFAERSSLDDGLSLGRATPLCLGTMRAPAAYILAHGCVSTLQKGQLIECAGDWMRRSAPRNGTLQWTKGRVRHN